MTDISEIGTIGEQERRRAVFSAMLTSEVGKRSGALAAVVGDEALELYSEEALNVEKIGIAASREAVGAVLGEWGFEGRGNLWKSEKYGLLVEWRAEEPPAGKPLASLAIDDRFTVTVESVEDLVLEKLASADAWGDEVSLRQARELARKKRDEIDLKYLREAAEKEDLAELLDEALG